MTEIRKIAENIWTFPIPLPNSPLKWLNCYVVKGNEGERNLLIDTGFNLKECHDVLDEGMALIGIKPENTDVLLTHFHNDHSGNASRLFEQGARIFMSRIDHERFLINESGGWDRIFDVYYAEGLPFNIYEQFQFQSRHIMYSSGPFEVTRLEEGDVLSYGGYDLQVIIAAGHTPGQVVLFDEKSGIMFTADHVLFDITPNISSSVDRRDNLGNYMNNLLRLKQYNVRLALPAHRNTGDQTLNERIDKLIVHHEQRIAETESVIAANPMSTAHQIASRMTWKITAKNWEEFPVTQKWFAMGETLAHIDYLINKGKVQRIVEEDRVLYKMI